MKRGKKVLAITLAAATITIITQPKMSNYVQPIQAHAAENFIIEEESFNDEVLVNLAEEATESISSIVEEIIEDNATSDIVEINEIDVVEEVNSSENSISEDGFASKERPWQDVPVTKVTENGHIENDQPKDVVQAPAIENAVVAEQKSVSQVFIEKEALYDSKYTIVSETSEEKIWNTGKGEIIGNKITGNFSKR